MYKNNLRLFEILWLNYLGRSDARNDVFGYCDRIGNYPDEAVTDLVAISSRMHNEIKVFVCERAKYIEKKKCRYSVPDKSKKGKKRKYASFEKAIADIDSRIAEGKHNIDLISASFNQMVEDINSELNSKGSVKDRTEIKTMYEKKRALIRREYVAVADKSREDVLMLLDEKIRLLKKLKRDLNRVLDRQMLRIDVYYKAAREEDKDLPINVVGKEELLGINRVDLCGEYEDEIVSSQNVQDSLKMLNKEGKGNGV